MIILAGISLMVSFEACLFWCFVGSVLAKWIMLASFAVAFVATMKAR